jgi:hypothetical protein
MAKSLLKVVGKRRSVSQSNFLLYGWANVLGEVFSHCDCSRRVQELKS